MFFIRSLTTGEIAMVNQLGEIKAWFNDTRHHDRERAHIMLFSQKAVAEHIAAFNINCGHELTVERKA